MNILTTGFISLVVPISHGINLDIINDRSFLLGNPHFKLVKDLIADRVFLTQLSNLIKRNLVDSNMSCTEEISIDIVIKQETIVINYTPSAQSFNQNFLA